MTPEAQRYTLALLGQDESMMNFYKTTEKIYSQRNKMPSIDQEQVQIMREYSNAWSDVSIQVSKIGNDIATWIAPGVTMMMKDMANAAENANKTKIVPRLLQATYNLIPTTDNIMMWNSSAANMIQSGFNNIFGLWGGRQTGQAQTGAYNIYMTNNINGNDTQAMKKAAKDAFTEAVAEAFHARHKGGN